jgi:hypothetical protein
MATAQEYTEGEKLEWRAWQSSRQGKASSCVQSTAPPVNLLVAEPSSFNLARSFPTTQPQPHSPDQGLLLSPPASPLLSPQHLLVKSSFASWLRRRVSLPFPTSSFSRPSPVSPLVSVIAPRPMSALPVSAQAARRFRRFGALASLPRGIACIGSQMSCWF